MAGTRTFSERESSGSEDESLAQKIPNRKPRSNEEAAIISAGSAMGLMGDLFRDFQAVLEAGIQANEHSPATALSYRQRKYQELYGQLLAMVPWIVDEIAKRGLKGTFSVGRELDAGRLSVRGADLHGIKKAVLMWDQYVPAIQADAKSTRGFNHPECGRLLCPATYDWSDPNIRNALRNGSRRHPAGARDWPYVLWLDEHIDQNDFSDGFLRNRRLVMAGRHSLLGPRAALNSVQVKMSARKPKAKIHRIRSVTVGFIAYTAVLVHFSLSSQESFGDGSTAGTFPYEEFYQSIVRYVEQTMTAEDRAELLAWWNIQIFGNMEFDYASEDEAASGRPPSVVAIMRAQAAAREIAVREVARAAMASASAAAP